MPSCPARVALALIAALCCASGLPAGAGRRDQPSARYLFSWSGDEDRQDSDFLAVIDLKREVGSFLPASGTPRLPAEHGAVRNRVARGTM